MKKILLLLPVLALLVSGCGQAAKPQAEKFSGSIADLIAGNKSAKCVLVAKQGESIISGTTYVSGTKSRTDYQLKGADNQVSNSHMINDGTWMYTWSDNNAGQAMKIKLDTLNSDQFKNTNAQTEAQNSGLDNYQAKMDYQCFGWAADSSQFVPPANVNFTDFSKIMDQAQKALQGLPTGGNTGNLCAQCDSMPNAQAKASCRQSLNCK